MGPAAEAFEGAWEEIQRILGVAPMDPNGIRALLERWIVAAVDKGERDPHKLKRIALGAVEN